MKKRLNQEVERDYRKVRKFLSSGNRISSFKEIAEATGLSESQVKTSLSRHPRVYSDTKELLAQNHQLIRAEKEAKKIAEKEAKIKAKKQKVQANNEKKEKEVKFVIDASITGIEGLFDLLNSITNSNGKIILTSITIKELEKLQKFSDLKGFDARKILAIAAENAESYECINIDETIGIPDDCIIKYCADNKKSVILLTSDKAMTLKARAYGVDTQYLKLESRNTSEEIIKFPTAKEKEKIKTTTLFVARKLNKKLFISEFETDSLSIRVISNGIEYNSGTVDLKIGDDVYIASKKNDYITFAHYQIISLTEKNNCRTVFHTRIYKTSDISKLPKGGYKSFVKDFKLRIAM